MEHTAIRLGTSTRLHLAPGEDALSAAGKLTEELRLKKEELGKAAREGDNL